MTLRVLRLGEPHPRPSPLTLPVARSWTPKASRSSRIWRNRRTHVPDQAFPFGFRHPPIRAFAAAWPERLDSTGAIATSCDGKWLALWVRVIEPIRPRTSSLGGGSPSCQDCDATSVEPRAILADCQRSREGPLTAHKGVTKRCVSSNPATDSRKFEHPLDVRLLVGHTLGLPRPSPPAQHPRNKSVRALPGAAPEHALELSPENTSTSGPVTQARALALPQPCPAAPAPSLRPWPMREDPTFLLRGTLRRGRAWYQVDRG